MPIRSKKQPAASLVELNLKVPKEKYPLVEEALTAILDLAGLKGGSEKSGQAAAAPAPGPGRKAKAVKAKPGRTKRPKQPEQSKAKPAPGRRAAADKTPPIPKTAAIIRDLRAEAGLSQKSLAEKLGVRQNTISLLETGRQKPDLDMAIKLGQILKTPFRNLFE